jgi:hypothetical protein
VLLAMNHSGKNGDAGEHVAATDRYPLGRRRADSALYGALLGVWWAMCIIIAGWCEQLLWKLAVAHIAHPPLAGTMAISKASQHFGLSRSAFLAIGVFAFAISGAASGYIVAILGQRLHVDPHQHSRRALFDAIRQWRPTLLWAMPVLLIFVIVLFIEIDHDSPRTSLTLNLAVGALFLLSPFLIFNRDVLESPSSSRLWLPQWPGWRIVAAGSLIAVAEALIGFALDLVPLATSPAFRLLTEPAVSIIGAFASAMLCAAWIDREGFRGLLYPLRTGHPWRVAGPFLALTIRAGSVMLWLAPLVLVPWLLTIYIVPSVASVLEDHGERLPHALSWIRIWAADGLLVLCALGTMIVFATGRTHVLASSMPTQQTAREGDSRRAV